MNQNIREDNMSTTIRTEEKNDHKPIYDVNKLAFQQEDENKLIEKIKKKARILFPDFRS